MASTLSIATWNVNSVKARLEHLLRYAREASPDILLLQELKCEEAAFPAMEIEELGYHCAVFGQKSYNGVAILSKFPLDDIQRALPDSETEGDAQARYIEAVACLPHAAVRVASIYVPNGQEVGSDKFAYKLRFFERLAAHAASLVHLDEAVILGGDYNIAPNPIDVYNPQKLEGTVCFHADERAGLRRTLNLGYYDAFRTLNPDKQQFSWWDYRGGSYTQNQGYRIDHLLLNPLAIDKTQSCHMDETPRSWDKPSDHTPVVVTISL